VSFRFKPVDAFLIRGSYNEGFSAPTLTALYAPNATTFTANRYNDPVLCPGGTVNAGAGGIASRDCGIQFQRLTGGNDKLTAEESTAWSLGFVVEPMRNLSLSVDFWNYHLKGTVSTLGEQTIFGDFNKYSALYVRCSQAPQARRDAIGACQIAGGDPLAYILETNQNLGDIKTNGVDIDLTWSSGATSTGRWGVRARGTYVDKFHFQVEPNSVWFTPVGNYRPQWGGPVIRYQQVTSFTWDSDALSLRLGNRWTSGYRDQNAQGAPFNVAPFNTNVVKHYSLWDASATYRWKGFTFGVGVLNLLDEDPPFTNQVGRFQARGYDDRFHDPKGRTYQVSARYEF
jgi:iron complex outermembrane recepter protein